MHKYQSYSASAGFYFGGIFDNLGFTRSMYVLIYMDMGMCMFIYIHNICIYVYVHIYRYIHIYNLRAANLQQASASGASSRSFPGTTR